MHNAPNRPVGTASVRAGAVMAAVDTMKIVIHGKGSHAARPHNGNDPIAVGLQLHTAFQHLCTKNIDPIEVAVVNVTRFIAGTAVNVVPPSAELHATIRTFDPGVRETVRRRVQEICKGIEVAYGVTLDLEYRMGCPPTINTPPRRHPQTVRFRLYWGPTLLFAIQSRWRAERILPRCWRFCPVPISMWAQPGRTIPSCIIRI